MEISERASLIFNNNGSIVVRHAFQTRDGKFHDIVVTDGEHRFRREDWVGCEKVLLKKIWRVYSGCIQEIQKHEKFFDKIAPEHVRFVYNKNPTKSNPEKTKLFITPPNRTLPPIPRAIGHWGEINNELEILSTILLKPRAMVLPPKSEPVVKTKTPKKATKTKTTAEKTVKPEKSTEPPTKKLAEPEKLTKIKEPPESGVKLPPIRPRDRLEDDLAAKPAPTDASWNRSAVKLSPVQRPASEARQEGAKKIVSRGMDVLGPAFRPRALRGAIAEESMTD